MDRRTRAVALALAALPLAARAGAQTAPEWNFTVAPYFWMAGLDGKVGVGRVATNVDLSFGDILDALQFAVMGTATARYKSYVFGVDGMYIATGGSKTFAFRGDTGSLSLNQKETMIQPTVGYTFISAASGFDVLVGLRYWHMSADLDVDRPRASNKRSGSTSWVDGTAGVQAHWMPMSVVRITLGGDIGAGGSKWTWQAYGGAGYDVATWCTLGLLYRGLSVDYDHTDFLYDANTQGFLLSATFRFK